MTRHLSRILIPAVLCAGIMAAPAGAADTAPAQTARATPTTTPAAPPGMPGLLPFNLQIPPTRPKEDIVPNTVQPSISPEARANFIGSLMAMNPFSLREMIAMMAVKYPAKEGLSFDDVVESMKAKANELNFKFVGHNPLWKDIVAITGKEDTPRVEFFSFCDALVARDILDLSLEFAIFLPCRVSVVEDAHKKIWLMTLDWDARWMDSSKNPNAMSVQLRAKAIMVREAIDKIMRAGAEGEF